MKNGRKKIRFRLSALFYALGILLLSGVCFSLLFEISLDQRSLCTEEIQQEITRWAEHYRLPPELVSALVWKESRYRTLAVGKKGEIGLMQLVPPDKPGAVSEWVRVKKCPVPSRRRLFSPSVNLEIGCWHLAVAVKRWEAYRCGTELALAQYNAGAGSVKKWKPDALDGEVLSRIDYPGTRAYVSGIMAKYQELLQKKKPKEAASAVGGSSTLPPCR